MLRSYLEELQKIKLLKPDEEKRLWMAYKDEGCMDSRGRLIEQYQPLVFREALRWHVGEEHMADVLQEGNLGLIEAVERYDYKLGVAFSVYAVHRIRGEIVDWLKKEGKSANVSMDEPDENGLTLGDMLSDNREDLGDRTNRQLLLEQVGVFMARLPEKEQFIMEAVYLKDRQPKTVAADLDVSLPYVYRLQKRGVRRIRGMFGRWMKKNK